MPRTLEDWKDLYYEQQASHSEFAAMSGHEHRLEKAELVAVLKAILYVSPNGFLGFHNLTEENAMRAQAAIAKAEGK